MTQYLDRTNAMPEYIPYPRFLLKLSLTPAAKLIYAMLLDRYTLSKKNNWQDEEGHIYLVYPVEKLTEDSGISISTVKAAMSELSDADLIRRRRKGFSKPSRIYMMIPDDTGKGAKKTAAAIAGCENNWKDWVGMHESARETAYAEEEKHLSSIQPEIIPVTEENQPSIQPEIIPVTEESQPSIQPEIIPHTAGNPTLTEYKNHTSYSTEIIPHTAGNYTPNQYNINNNTFNHLTQTKERVYGEFGNVMLTEAEYGELNAAYPDIFPVMLDFLSARIRDKAIPDEPHGVILRRMLE